ncbi:Flp family type IVb pilin [Oryzibacter oryziterrae]|uniref:Flp family type IVb pilin n=1 Tax=Oryzibacter oryziterrae TaxID=2766474 RepID=UPI001F289142|nr:Flp family type IVb pilin [Oryzibacter oryziterrae]
MPGEAEKFSVLRLVSAFARDERGATALEYGILASMIVVALAGISTLSEIADAQNRVYGLLTNAMR